MVRCARESVSDVGRDATSAGGGADWFSQTTTYFYGGDAAKSGAIGNYGQSWMQTTVQGEGIISFYWKVSSQNGPDFLEFVVDGVRQASISGVSEWQKKVISITGSGTHTLQWQYTKDSSSSYGSDCGWVDYVQWPTVLTDWDTVSYTYDPSGRRIAKAYDGHLVMKYLYDGDSIIAEYDATGALVHKYIYGPGVDQPICMIDASDANATYYYHFDGLGSVIALTDSAGAVANLYEYSIFGEVSASDPNHPNRFLFTGREFDSETGLYYYRARYYNPYIGRFLQTDSVGYGAGMNLYRYCLNNPLNWSDPFGLDPCDSNDTNDANDANDVNDFNDWSPWSPSPKYYDSSLSDPVYSDSTSFGGDAATDVTLAQNAAAGVGFAEAIAAGVGEGVTAAASATGVGIVAAVTAGVAYEVGETFIGEPYAEEIATPIATAYVAVGTAYDAVKDVATDVYVWAFHKKGKGKSKWDDHSYGEGRGKIDYGGENGDASRGYPRRRPRGWRGPWPPLPRPKPR